MSRSNEHRAKGIGGGRVGGKVFWFYMVKGGLYCCKGGLYCFFYFFIPWNEFQDYKMVCSYGALMCF